MEFKIYTEAAQRRDEMLNQRRRDAMGFLQDVINKNPGALQPADINSALDSVDTPYGFRIPTERKVPQYGASDIPNEVSQPIHFGRKNTLYRVWNPDTESYDQMSLPEGYSDMKVIGKPAAPRGVSRQPTPAERAALNTFKQYDMAVTNDAVTPELRKRVKSAATLLKMDPTEFDEEPPPPPVTPPPTDEGPSLHERAMNLFNGGQNTQDQVGSLQKKLAARTQAAGGAPDDQAAIAHLISIRAKITPKNIEWAKGRLKAKK